jgi:hypothetical protein
MRRIRLFHWNAKEATPLVEQLKGDGYTVDYPGDKVLEQPFRTLRESPPYAIVIDLTRLPSRGRHLAGAIRSVKTIRSIPIVFVDGDRKKIERIRAELPDAIYTSSEKLGAALKRAKPLVNPASPPYSNRTIAQKLGIREGMRVAVVDAPRGYATAVGTLPAGTSFEEDPVDVLPFTLWFVRKPEEYLGALPRMRQLANDSRLWVIYPKQHTRQKTSAEVTLFFIRETASRVGLIHYKTCSLDTTWTGIALALRK